VENHQTEFMHNVKINLHDYFSDSIGRYLFFFYFSDSIGRYLFFLSKHLLNFDKKKNIRNTDLTF